MDDPWCRSYLADAAVGLPPRLIQSISDPSDPYVFTKTGTRLAAGIIEDAGMIDHSLHWAEATTRIEALYRVAILNSEATRLRIAQMQARGEQGHRILTSLSLTLPIPLFDRHDVVHAVLATEATAAERIAAAVAVPTGTTFQKARGLVQDAFAPGRRRGHIDVLVAELLGPDPRHAAGDAELAEV